MDEITARRIIGNAIQDDGGLYDLGAYLAWSTKDGDSEICLDGSFSADELEAFAWWMRKKGSAQRPALTGHGDAGVSVERHG